MEFKFYLDEHIKNTKDDTKKIEQKEVLANTNNLTEDQIITQIMVRDAIEKLPNKEKQVIELRYFQDKSQEAAGKILNTTQVTISRKEKSALKHLKMIFERIKKESCISGNSRKIRLFRNREKIRKIKSKHILNNEICQ